jgi:IS5 family transposase
MTALGVKTAAIPRKGKPGAARRGARRSTAAASAGWSSGATGCEGSISHLKHGYGWDRTLLHAIDGAQTWFALGVLAHNSVKIAALVDAKAARQRTPTTRQRAP